MARTSFFQDILQSVTDRGRTLIELPFGSAQSAPDRIRDLAWNLVSTKGEASGVARAGEILSLYRSLSEAQKRSFLLWVSDAFAPDLTAVERTARAFLETPGSSTMDALADALESPRQELFRRLNLAPGATRELVEIRRQVLDWRSDEPKLERVNSDLLHLFGSWFNRGFLTMQPIDWATPAAVLEKIIAYEAVHKIDGWDDLKRRLEPSNKRCFAFFHPSLADDPLIFVEVALTHSIPDAIDPLLEGAYDGDDGRGPTTAVFYSISNCQRGLAGISFGNFLIKQVVRDLVQEIPTLDTFVTLSPVPGFARWLESEAAGEVINALSNVDRELVTRLSSHDWLGDAEATDALSPAVASLLSHYLVSEKKADGMPIDPVARFHLGNGASLERINWPGDLSSNGLRQAHGAMVNYLYDMRHLERNHEAFVNEGTVAASRRVRAKIPVITRSAEAVPTETA